MDIGTYLQSTPWAVPGWVAGSVLLVVAGVVGRRRPWVRGELVVLGVAVWGFVCVTLAPNPRVADLRPGYRQLLLDPVLVDPADLLSQSFEPGLNVLIAVPMALVAAYVAVRHRLRWPLVVVVLLPLVVELVQVAVTGLGRSAFVLGDVTANWQGVAMASVPGALMGLVVRRARGEGADDDRRGTVLPRA